METEKDDLINQLPLRYTDEEVSTLGSEVQSLMRTPEWQSFTRVLDTMIHEAREQGFADIANIMRWKGFVEGIEAVYEMAVWLPARSKKLMEAEEIKAKRTEKRNKTGFPDDHTSLTI
jgi:hypothetical protein